MFNGASSALSHTQTPFFVWKKIIAANHLDERIKPIQAAVGATTGTCPLEVSTRSSMAVVAGPSPKFDNPVVIEMRLCTLDEVSAAEGVRPDFLKIDVEGLVEVLKGAAECLKSARHVVWVPFQGIGRGMLPALK